MHMLLQAHLCGGSSLQRVRSESIFGNLLVSGHLLERGSKQKKQNTYSTSTRPKSSFLCTHVIRKNHLQVLAEIPKLVTGCLAMFGIKATSMRMRVGSWDDLGNHCDLPMQEMIRGIFTCYNMDASCFQNTPKDITNLIEHMAYGKGQIIPPNHLLLSGHLNLSDWTMMGHCLLSGAERLNACIPLLITHMSTTISWTCF